MIENNFKHHEPNDDQQEKYGLLRSKAKAMAFLIQDLCPDSREKALAMTNLEQSIMWANASIARNKETRTRE